MQTPNILFVILDGGRARFVKRAGPRRALTTFHEMDGSKRLNELRVAGRGRPGTQTFVSGGAGSHAPNNDDLMRQGKQAFVAEVAAQALRILREQSLDAIFAVAPGRLLRGFQDHLPADIRVAGVLALDLTKTPDADLAKWLHPLPTPTEGRAGAAHA